ncbi:hypothetical protein Tco_1372622, partial [Tanacetum coccineum]
MRKVEASLLTTHLFITTIIKYGLPPVPEFSCPWGRFGDPGQPSV